MNERDFSPKQKNIDNTTETTESPRFADIEIHDFDPEATTQKVYLSPDTVGLVTGFGEYRDVNGQPTYDDEGNVVLVGEVIIFDKDGQATTRRGMMSDILDADIKFRDENLEKRQRQKTLGGNMAGIALGGEPLAIAPMPDELPPHPDDELGRMVSRREVLDMLAREHASVSGQTDMIEVPREFVPEGSTARFDQIDHSLNVPYSGIPTSAKYAPGTIYGTGEVERDAYVRHMQNTREQSNDKE